ncbi:hypothetical protein NFJ02_18g31690 [Pycnococcus provasolii]
MQEKRVLATVDALPGSVKLTTSLSEVLASAALGQPTVLTSAALHCRLPTARQPILSCFFKPCPRFGSQLPARFRTRPNQCWQCSGSQSMPSNVDGAALSSASASASAAVYLSH